MKFMFWEIKKDYPSSVLSAFNKEFETACLNQSISRLKLLNTVMLPLCAFLFISDFFTLSSIKDETYRSRLLLIHLCILAVVLSYLLLLYGMKNLNNRIQWYIVDSYIVLATIIGIVLSLNNAKVDFNIYSYITITLFLLSTIPTRRAFTTTVVLLGQFILLVLLRYLDIDFSIIAITQVNSIVVTIIALLIYHTFYYLRRNDFMSSLILMERERSMTSLFEINPLPLFVIEPHTGKILRMSQRAFEVFEIDASMTKQLVIADFNITNHEAEVLLQLVQKEKCVKDYIVKISKGNCDTWVMLNCELISYNHEPGILVAVVDITKSKNLEEQLVQKSTIDPLTGTLNRMRGIEHLTQLHNNMGTSYQSLVVIFIDLNGLKLINDRFGHLEGDRAIQIIAQTIQECIFPTDLFFRYGGDEFILTLLDLNESSADALMGKIQDSLLHKKRLYKLAYDLSISFGVCATHVYDTHSIEECLHIADERMYDFKRTFYQKNSQLSSRKDDRI